MAKYLLEQSKIVFDPINKQITLKSLSHSLNEEQILGIINKTKGVSIYSPIDNNKGGVLTQSGDNYILNLTYDTTSMSSSDILQVWLYNDEHKQNISIYKDDPLLTSFGRIRTSANPKLLFNSIHTYGDNQRLWRKKIIGSATIVDNVNEQTLDLNLTTSAGDTIIHQSKHYIQTQPSTSPLIRRTFKFGQSDPNRYQEIGLFDDYNGVFLRENNGVVSIVFRDYLNGSVNDIVIQQSDWNIDTMDGNGPSQLTIDWNNVQHLIIDFQGLLAGKIRVGFEINHTKHYVHIFDSSNIYLTAYNSNMSLPIRTQIYNTNTTTTSCTFKEIASTYQIEDGDKLEDSIGVYYSISTKSSKKTISHNILTPLISIKPKTTYNGKTFRGVIIPERVTPFNTNAETYIAIVLNGTLNGAVWTPHPDSTSATEYDISATSINGGEIIEEDYINKKGSIDIGNILKQHPLSLDIDGNAGDILTLCAIDLKSTRNKGFAAINWKEIK